MKALLLLHKTALVSLLLLVGTTLPISCKAEKEASKAQEADEGAIKEEAAATKCRDSPLQFAMANGKFYECSDIGTGLSINQCHKERIASHCPDTCNQCLRKRFKCADSRAVFLLPRTTDMEKDCAWLANMSEEKKKKKCLSVKIKRTCRHTCDYCDDGPTPSPPASAWQRELQLRLEELVIYMDTNSTFKHDLKYTINAANDNAMKHLNHKLYKAFLKGVNGWPTSIDEYLEYLTWRASYVPQQTDYKGWLNGTTQDYNSTHQEVFDRLCHFYYLINQPLPSGGTVQDNTWFANWLVEYAQVWGKFCNSPDSISPETIFSFVKNSKSFNITDSMIPMNKEDIPGNINNYTIYNDKGDPMRPNSPSGWMSWNQMFAREMNPGLRPIDSPTNNTVVCAPADCTFRAAYPINEKSEVQDVRIKRTHNIGNVVDLLKGSQYNETFANGTFVHYFLGPYSYHRFHTPVDGVVKESFAVKGFSYLDVDIDGKGQFDAADDATNGYEFVQARGVITIDTTYSPYGNVGIVAVIPIGMCQVSSVSMIATEGATLRKGDEFGYFQFGGSDIIMLFQEGVVPESNLFDLNETNYNHYGMQVATANVKND